MEKRDAQHRCHCLPSRGVRARGWPQGDSVRADELQLTYRRARLHRHSMARSRGSGVACELARPSPRFIRTSNMRSYLVVLLALATSTMLASSAAAQGEMQPLASGRGTSEVTLLLVDSAARASAEPSTIRVDYGQPHLRGRELHT